MKILILILKFLLERKVLLFTQWILQKNILILMQIIEVSGIENFAIIINSTDMIKYKLACKNCETTFDSWFASSKEFEKLKKKQSFSLSYL